MVDAVESMAYNKVERPWHGLGNPVEDNLTPHEMLVAANLDWRVEKRPVYYEKGGKMEQVPGEFALTRDSDESVLSMVGSKWKEVQNEQGLDFFKKFTEAGHMKMETAGSLWNGRYVWALARLAKDFKLGKNDEVQGNLLMCLPHIHGKAGVIQFTPVRVVCWNTLSMALGPSLLGGKGAFRMPHTVHFNDTVAAKAEEALGIGQAQMDLFKQAATLLSKTKAAADEVEAYFCEVLKFKPEEARMKKNGESTEKRSLKMFRAALESAPGQQLATAAGTWWGALNAVTYVVDHELGRSRETALKNAWLGNTARIKRDALSLALDRAK